jgi:osmotically-inducible protein OsmY
VPGLLDADTVPLSVGASILGGLASSRLDNVLVREDQTAVSVSASDSDFHRVGIFDITVDVKPGSDPAAVNARLDAVLADLIAHGPTEEEVARVATSYASRRIQGLEQVNGKASVLAELAWEPSVTAAHIGVTAHEGVISLTGHVKRFAEKHAAETAALRVRGVKAVADEIEVKLPFDVKRSDEDIARAAVDRLAWDSTIPLDSVKVAVQDGWVTLTGEVKKTDLPKVMQALSALQPKKIENKAKISK